MRRFNTTGVCIPEKHYMVDITDRLKEIKAMIDEGAYFTINRARQYGKTTTLNELRKFISDEYTVLFLDFQGISTAGFATEGAFVRDFSRLINRRIEAGLVIQDQCAVQIEKYARDEEDKARLADLFEVLRRWCASDERGIVLMIDEVDSASNNQVFLDFLAQLREGYIERDTMGTPAFQSVILAGVTDIKHLKRKIRDDSQHKVNSPWNIATEFDIDMELWQSGVEKMLDSYAQDHKFSMDSHGMSELIMDYSGGYPFLVSRICQLLDAERIDSTQRLSDLWTEQGVLRAIKKLQFEKNTLFDSLMGKLINYPEIKWELRDILMKGEQITYNPDREEHEQLLMYGFIKNEGGLVAVANRIFESRLYDFFISENEKHDGAIVQESLGDKSIFVKNGALDMLLILEKFIKTYTQIFGKLEDKFKEKDGRELFLLYLKPIINGTGNYYIEAQTRDQGRMDVVVDYLGKQYVIELKIWRGERYNEQGEQQIMDYLDYFDLQTGYMLSFNFNKKKEQGVKRLEIDGKVLFEGML